MVILGDKKGLVTDKENRIIGDGLVFKTNPPKNIKLLIDSLKNTVTRTPPNKIITFSVV